MLTRTEILAAKKKGHTHAASRDLVSIGKIDRRFVSTHKTFEQAAFSLRDGKGNAVYLIDDALGED